ncbi:MAG: FecR domain-containing protein [Limnochordaceae bacterium]|nr:FecR domain-containing protein [Limnochordaceae bacterium]
MRHARDKRAVTQPLLLGHGRGWRPAQAVGIVLGWILVLVAAETFLGAGSTPPRTLEAASSQAQEQFPPGLSAAEPAGVYLTACSGDVQVWAGSWGRWVAAFPQMRLGVGDQVKTGAGAGAEIAFGSRAVVRLGEKTWVVILREDVAVANETHDGGEAASPPTTHFNTSPPLAKPALRVQVGQVLVQVAKGVSRLFDFTVETPTAWAGVRGTVFTVWVAEDGSTDVMVHEGWVEVSAGGRSLLVGAGERAVVAAHGKEAGTGPQKRPPFDRSDAVKDEDQNGAGHDEGGPAGGQGAGNEHKDSDHGGAEGNASSQTKSGKEGGEDGPSSSPEQGEQAGPALGEAGQSRAAPGTRGPGGATGTASSG